MARLLYSCLVIIGFAAFTAGQIISESECPEVKLQENFVLDTYLGEWFENQKYPAVFQSKNGKCVSAKYTKLDTGDVNVENSQWVDNVRKVATGQASAAGPASFKVVFPNSKYPAPDGPNYQVLSTDYTSYSVVYSCRAVPQETGGIKNYTLLWILTRERNPSQEVIDKALAVLDENHISRANLVKTDQTDCPEN